MRAAILFDGDMNGYFSSANASLMRRIASTIFSSEVAVWLISGF